MAREAEFQKKIIRWLRSKGAFVWKCHQNATTRAGVADLFLCKEGFYAWLEVKKAKNSPVRPGQKQFIEKMNKWSYARFVYPENWEEVKEELKELLRD